MTTCTKPDRDEPRLVCGYPLPCPHHTVAIDASRLSSSVQLLGWLHGNPTIVVVIRTLTDGGTAESYIEVLGLGQWKAQTVWRGTRRLGFDARIAELRDATDELTREAHCELEKIAFGDVQR